MTAACQPGSNLACSSSRSGGSLCRSYSRRRRLRSLFAVQSGFSSPTSQLALTKKSSRGSLGNSAEPVPNFRNIVVAGVFNIGPQNSSNKAIGARPDSPPSTSTSAGFSNGSTPNVELKRTASLCVVLKYSSPDRR